jgi:hypothetical protein
LSWWKVKVDDPRDIGEALTALFGEQGNTTESVFSLKETSLIHDILVRACAPVRHRLSFAEQTDGKAAPWRLLAKQRREAAPRDVRRRHLVDRQTAVFLDEAPHDRSVWALVVDEEHALRRWHLRRVQRLDALKEALAQVRQREFARRVLRSLELGQLQAQVGAEFYLQAGRGEGGKNGCREHVARPRRVFELRFAQRVPESEGLQGHSIGHRLEAFGEVVSLRHEDGASGVTAVQDVTGDSLISLTMVILPECLEFTVIDEQQVRQAQNPRHRIVWMLRPVEAGVEADPKANIDLFRPFEQPQNLARGALVEKRRDMHITRCGYVFRERIEVLPDVSMHRVVRARVDQHHSISVVYVRQTKTAELFGQSANPVMGDAEFVHLIDKRQPRGLDPAENPDVCEPDTHPHLREAENRQPRRPAKRMTQ